MCYLNFVVLFLLFSIISSCQKLVPSPELKQAWTEINQEKDIYINYSELIDKSIESFDENEEVQYEHLAQKEEQRILHVQSLVEKASYKELSHLIN